MATIKPNGPENCLLPSKFTSREAQLQVRYLQSVQYNTLVHATLDSGSICAQGARALRCDGIYWPALTMFSLWSVGITSCTLLRYAVQRSKEYLTSSHCVSSQEARDYQGQQRYWAREYASTLAASVW
jgi:hypothetical protein